MIFCQCPSVLTKLGRLRNNILYKVSLPTLQFQYPDPRAILPNSYNPDTSDKGTGADNQSPYFLILCCKRNPCNCRNNISLMCRRDWHKISLNSILTTKFWWTLHSSTFQFHKNRSELKKRLANVPRLLCMVDSSHRVAVRLVTSKSAVIAPIILCSWKENINGTASCSVTTRTPFGVPRLR